MAIEETLSMQSFADFAGRFLPMATDNNRRDWF